MSDVLYLGDTHLRGAAAYLAGLMHSWGWSFDYVPGETSANASLFENDRPLYVLSDYPAAHLTVDVQQRIVDDVSAGAGLLMIGGWDSFHGSGGNWDGTPVGEALPVAIASADDRVNCDHPLVVAKTAEHPAVDGLPWDERPPLIGGFNRVAPRRGATLLLEARHFSAHRDGDEFSFEPAGSDPLLIVGERGRGKTAALATDVAPHWVGPLVDWGDARVITGAPEADEVEVGDLYAKFLRQLLTWLRR
ncbi:MAG: glutamine amidotransferase [Planctomycetaceae bacterium]